MPDTTSRPATATPQKWPPLTPVQVVAVPRWLAWSLIGLALVLAGEIALATMHIGSVIREEADRTRRHLKSD